MSISGQKGQIWTKKGPKRAGPDFSWPLNINFPQEHHKTSIYTKNQQNAMNCLEDIGSNVDFGPKRGKFGPKGPKKGGTRFFPKFLRVKFHKIPMNGF